MNHTYEQWEAERDSEHGELFKRVVFDDLSSPAAVRYPASAQLCCLSILIQHMWYYLTVHKLWLAGVWFHMMHEEVTERIRLLVWSSFFFLNSHAVCSVAQWEEIGSFKVFPSLSNWFWKQALWLAQLVNNRPCVCAWKLIFWPFGRFCENFFAGKLFLERLAFRGYRVKMLHYLEFGAMS